MELLTGHPEWESDDTAATGEQLERWIKDNPAILKMLYKMMTTPPTFEGNHHTWADFTQYGGNEAASLDILITGENLIHIEVSDEDMNTYAADAEIEA